MVNIILAILLINLFIHYISKTPYTALNCGIWGFHGENNNNFSWNKFHILGIINDKRGGDATGRMIGKEYEHHNQRANKNYTDFVSNILNPPYKDENIIFGHTRKTSATAVNTDGIAYTQPYPIRDAEGDIIGMGMHNGTLYNADDLRDKYGVPEELEYYNEDEVIKHKCNDSQILLWTLLIKQDYSILENYEGSAALAWYDFRNERLYLFRGESRLSSYATINSTERPLYTLQESKNIWFSSEEKPLWIISQRKFPEINEIDANTVLIYEKGLLVDKIDIVRRKGQYREYYNNNSTGYNYPGYNNRSLPSATDTEKAMNAIEEEAMPHIYNSLVYTRGRYWVSKNKKAHGIYHLDCTGKISEEPVISRYEWYKTRPYYFIEGVMITDHTSFNEYIRKYKKNTKSSKEYFLSKKLVKVAVYPVHSYGFSSGNMCYWDTKKDDWWYYTGKVTPLFSNKTYNYEKGTLKSTISGSYIFADHKLISNDWVDDQDKAEREYELAYQQYEEDSKNEMYMDKLPSDDDFESPEDQLIRKDVINEVANALVAVEECISSMYIYTGSDIGDKAMSVLESVKGKLSKLGEND